MIVLETKQLFCICLVQAKRAARYFRWASCGLFLFCFFAVVSVALLGDTKRIFQYHTTYIQVGKITQLVRVSGSVNKVIDISVDIFLSVYTGL